MPTMRMSAPVLVCLSLLAACTADQRAETEGVRSPVDVTSPVMMPTGSLPPRIEALPTRCPSAEVQPQFPPDGMLPNGATQIRICNLTGDEMTIKQDRVELDFRVPADALTTNVDRVVDAINAAATRVPEEVEERTFCGGQGAPTQVLWFSYAETDLAITYNDGTCADLDLGDATVGGGDTVAVVLSDLLWEQRESLPPPTVRLRARCSPNLTEDTPLVLTDRLDLVDAVVCEYPYGVRQARLTPAAVRAINTDFATSEGFTEQAGCPPRMFRGVTAWGDRFSWWGSCWNFAIQNTYGTALHWQASPTEQTILEDLRFGPPRKQVTTHPGR